MWRLKIGEAVAGDGGRLRTANALLGRQVWEFDARACAAEEGEEVEAARAEFAARRHKVKHSADLLMRLQFAKENPVDVDLRAVGVQDDEEVTEAIVADVLRRALTRYSALQAHDGHWPGDFSGCFIVGADMVIALYVTGAMDTVISKEHNREMRRYLYNHQNRDGGWGMHIEGDSTMYSSVLSYVTLRLLGEEPDGGGGAMKRAQDWILSHGSATAIPTLGKMWLSVLGVFDWAGVYPFPPELWLLPYFVPIHPGRLWCHLRVPYMGFSYLYGKKFVAAATPTLLSLRRELYNISYRRIDWNKARHECAKEDLINARPLLQRIIFAVVHKFVEPILMHWPGNKLREKALAAAIRHLHYEAENSRYIFLTPLSKAPSIISCWIHDSNSEVFKLQLPRIRDYLWLAEDGMRVKVSCSTGIWDAALSVQAYVSTDLLYEHGPTLKRAHAYIKNSQICCDYPGEFRHRSKGGWPLSNLDEGWAVSDCTGEALKAALLLSRISPDVVGQSLEKSRLYDAVDFLLSLRCPNGGFGTYETTRSYSWLQLIIAAENIGNVVIDTPFVECTSSVLQALALFKELHGDYRKEEIEDGIAKAADFIEKNQQSDGSWYGSWGVCYTYGTMFGIKGLVAAGRPNSTGSRIHKACRFLLSKQLPSGGWGESHLSCLNKVYTNLEGDRAHAAITAWAMLALIEAGQAERDAAPLHQAARCLINLHAADGEFPQQEFTGASYRIIMLNYSQYRNIYPVWALGEYRRRVLRGGKQLFL